MKTAAAIAAILLCLSSTATADSPVALAIYGLQIAADMRPPHEPVVSIPVRVCMSLSPRCPITYPGLLPVPPGKVFVVTGVEAFVPDWCMTLAFFVRDWGDEVRLEFCPNMETLFAPFAVFPGQVLEGRIIAPPPPDDTLVLLSGWLVTE